MAPPGRLICSVGKARRSEGRWGKGGGGKGGGDEGKGR